MGTPNMPDPTDPAFLPRMNINRSDFSAGLTWLDRKDEEDEWRALQYSTVQCSTVQYSTALQYSPASCDEIQCSYSVCDNSSPVKPSHSTSYYECCVKVSASKLLDHWLND